MKNSNSWGLFLNPFTRIAGWKAFYIGFVIVVATVLIGYLSDVSFFGVLDVKMGKHLNLASSFLFQAIGLAGTTLFVYLAGIFFSKHVRFQDVLGTTVLSRFPFILAALLGFMAGDVDEKVLLQSALNGTFLISDYVGLIITGILIIPIVIWHLILLYNAFKVSTGLKNSIAMFIGIVILSELFSFTMLFLVLKL